MKNRSGYCTEEDFWEAVEEINWEGICNDRKNHRKVEVEILRSWSMDFGSGFRSILSEKERDVAAALDKAEKGLDYEEKNSYWLGDDSFGDLCSHVVGCGKKVFEHELEKPELLIERAKKGKYVEKFSYVIPYGPLLSDEKYNDVQSFLEGLSYRFPTKESEWSAEECPYMEDNFEGYMDAARENCALARCGDWNKILPREHARHARKARLCLDRFIRKLEPRAPLDDDRRAGLEFAEGARAFFLKVEELRDPTISYEEAGKRFTIDECGQALRAWWGLAYIAEDVGAFRKDEEELLPHKRIGVYAGENYINDFIRYMLRGDGFDCMYHYNQFKKED